MQHYWHTPIIHRPEEKVSVEMNVYSEGWGIWEFKEVFFFYVCMEEGVIKQNTWKLIAE